MAANANTLDMGGPGQNPTSGQIAAQGVTAAWTRLFVAQVYGRKGRLGIRGKVAVAALTNMQLIRSMRKGGIEAGDYTVIAADTDFATLAGSIEIQNVLPTAPHTTGVGLAFDLILLCSGVAEYALEVKGNTATVAIDFSCD